MAGEYAFKAGIDLHIEVFGNHRRRQARLVGELGAHHLIIADVPGREQQGLAGLAATPGETLIVRFLEDGVIRGFRSPVTRIFSDPEPFLIIGRPQRVDQVSVRAHPRLPCRIPAQVQVADGEPRRALVVDVSQAGFSIAAAGIEAAPDTTVTARLRIPESDQLLRLDGQVRRVRREDGYLRLGIASDGMSEWFDTLSQYLSLDETMS